MIQNIIYGDRALINDKIDKTNLNQTIAKFLSSTSYSIHSKLLELDSMEIIGLLGTIETKNNLEIDLSCFDGDRHLVNIEELTKYILENGREA